MPRRIDREPDDRPLHLAYEQDAIASLVRIAAVLGSARFQRGFDPDGVIPDDANAIPALYSLATRGPQRAGMLAADLHVSAPTVSRLLEKLAAAGLIERAPDPSDSRATVARLSAAGDAVAAGIFRAGDELVTDLLADWSAADRDALGALLHRFATALDDRARPAHTTPTPPEE